MLSVVPASTTQ